MYDRIIVPIDDRDGEGPVRAGAALARRLGASLTLLHVHHPVEAPDALEGLPQYRFQHVVEVWDGRDADDEAHEVEWLAARAAAVSRRWPALRVSSRVVHAPLARSVRNDGERVMVVAVADGGEPGPTAREMIRAGGAPVLLLRPDSPDLDAFRHIHIGLDGSHFSEEILDPALELAHALDARVSLVEVVCRHHGLGRLLHPGERSAQEADASLRAVRDRIGRGRIDIRVIEAADPARALVTEAAGESGVVFALATHGRGGLRRMVMGSVAERVVADSRAPVLLYRPVGVGQGARELAGR